MRPGHEKSPGTNPTTAEHERVPAPRSGQPDVTGIAGTGGRELTVVLSQRTPPAHGVRFVDAVRVWVYIGLNTFGGPAGQIAVMHRELVERRRWLSERRFLHALNYCMVLPGPEAQQLATYVGWLMHGVPGGTVAGSLFVVPGFAAMMALSIAYALYGQVTWVSGLLFGLAAAVVAIVVEAVVRIGRRTLRSPALRAVAAASFLAIFLFGVLFPFIILAAGLLGWVLGRPRPGWFTGGAH